MKRTIVLTAICLLACSCTDSSSAQRTLKAHGFTDIETTGYSMFSCGEDDFSKTGFRAKNAQGAAVEGTVCCGLVVKDCTVRF